ncbi:MAG: 2-oxoacid:acceptor oxidoreductase family protein, partial [Clostridia bacterium]
TKEAGSVGEPLYLDVCASIFEMGRTNLKVIGGRYGLGGKDFSPKHVKAICDNLRTSESKNHFTVGIDDDVSFLSLKTDDNFSISNSTTKEFKFFGLGSDGTVSANKNTIKIIGNETDKYVQGYFEYDSKKSGSLTISHLRISKDPIKSAYTLNSADFIACHNYSFISRYDILKGLKQNGTVLLNTCLTEEELADNLPNNFKKTITEKSAKLYFINAAQIASACGLKNKINVIMQAAFFKISDVIDFATAEKELKAAIVKTYGKKGDAVINANISAVDSAITDIKELNVKLLKIKDEEIANVVENEYYQNFIKPIESLEGNSLKVSAFNKCGIVPTDTAKFEKRGISEACPVWQSENCIQCGKCIMACPHAAIRAVLTDKDEKLPDNFKTIPALGIKDKNYRIQISPLDCTGCNVCANVCPARNKALKMTLTTNELDKQKENFLFAESFENKQTVFSKETVKGLQFEKPYFEFSGACAGCGETPYIKALTQLFGDQMIIANATGCSSIYGGSAPSCPYAKNSAGNGPAWASSLFEDNAEFGLGIALAVADKKEKISLLCEKAICDNTFSKETNDMLTM